MVLVILDGITNNCVLSSGRFGVVGSKTAMDSGVREQGVPNERKIILTKTVSFFPAWLQHLAQQFKHLEDGGNTSLRNDGAFKHDTVQKPKIVAKF
jgi:hypothetical protein